jgi:hypothetical protein
MVSWVVKVKAAAHLEPVVFGNIECEPNDSRAQVKLKIHAAVRKHFPETAKVIGIAKGRLTLELHSEWEAN